MTTIHELGTPSALIDTQRMERNIRRMQDRGLTNLTISKLVQIRIFKLDE